MCSIVALTCVPWKGAGGSEWAHAVAPSGAVGTPSGVMGLRENGRKDRADYTPGERPRKGLNMSIYDRTVDPFAVVRRPTPAAVERETKAEAVSTKPVQGVVVDEDLIGKASSAQTAGIHVPDEFRPLFTKEALRALEYVSPPVVLGEDGEPVKVKKSLDLSKIGRAPIELCLRLRERVQFNMDTYVTPNNPKPVQINSKWIIAADRMIRLDGIDMSRATEVIEWATEDRFWRSNILSMQKLREQMQRLMMDDRFLLWREKAGLVAWPIDVSHLCTSMVELLDFVYPGEPHQAEPTWFRGASELLKRYSAEDVEDMMVWSTTSPKHISNLGSLLMFGWVADQIRRDNAFILWSQEMGREWAMGALALTPTPMSGGRGSKPRGQRIGAHTASEEVFRQYAEATRPPA